MEDNPDRPKGAQEINPTMDKPREWGGRGNTAAEVALTQLQEEQRARGVKKRKARPGLAGRIDALDQKRRDDAAVRARRKQLFAQDPTKR